MSNKADRPGGAQDMSRDKQSISTDYEASYSASHPPHVGETNDRPDHSSGEIGFQGGHRQALVEKPTPDVNVLAVHSDNERLKGENNNLSSALRELRLEQSKTQTILQGYQNDLEVYASEIFSLQPPDQVADDVIQREWDTLCERVEQWIDDESGHVAQLDRIPRREIDVNEPLADAIDTLKGPQGQQEMRASGSYILDFALSQIIHVFLYRKILAQHVPFIGLRPPDVRLLRELKANLSGGELHRDPARIALWESETILAMRANAWFAREREKQVRSIGEDAENHLKDLLRQRKSDAMSSFRQNIIASAVELASIIRCSSRDYYFDFRANPRIIYRSHLEQLQARDARSRKLLKAGQAGQTDPIGEGILVVQPALLRRRAGATERLLRKPLLLAVGYNSSR